MLILKISFLLLSGNWSFLFLEKGENRKVNVKIQKNDNKSWTIEYNDDVVFLKQTLGRESALKFHQKLKLEGPVDRDDLGGLNCVFKKVSRFPKPLRSRCYKW